MSVWNEDPQPDNYCGGDVTHDPHGECPGMFDFDDGDDGRKEFTENGWCYRAWHDGDCCQGSRDENATPGDPIADAYREYVNPVGTEFADHSDCCESECQYGGREATYCHTFQDPITRGYRDEMPTSKPRPKAPAPWKVYLRRNVKRVHTWRRYRGPWFDFEWHNYSNVRYIQVGISSPYEHAWWATSISIYTSLGHGPSILGWIPSKTYRYYGR